MGEWPPAKIFTAAVAVMYGVLGFITFALFIRKLMQTLRLRGARQEARLLDDRQNLTAAQSSAASAVGVMRAGGGAAVDDHHQYQYGASGLRGAGGAGAMARGMQANSQSHWSLREKRGETGGPQPPFSGARSSVPDADDLCAPTGSGRGSINSDLHNGSDICVEVQSDGGVSIDTMRLAQRGTRADNGSYARAADHARADGGGGPTCCQRFCECVGRPLNTCCGMLFCAPDSFFAERNNSSLFLLGSMFAYSVARCVNVAQFCADFEELQKAGALSMYASVVTIPPAIFLLALQLGFNLKWVVNVRAISSAGSAAVGGFGSRLSLGPSRSALSISSWRSRNNNANRRNGTTVGGGAADDDGEDEESCSCDLGTTALATGVLCFWLFPVIALFGVIAYAEGVRTPPVGSKSNGVEFLGMRDIGWIRLLAGSAGVPYFINGVWTIVIGIVLKVVWQPFSTVAMSASRNMFIVALVWGGLCVLRGILLLSYELKNFNDQTQSAWASPAVLMGEGCLIYLVLLVFYLSSRNQEEVVAAEREARRRISRLERTGGVGAEDLPDTSTSAFLRPGGAGGGGGRAGMLNVTNTSKDATSNGQLGLPIYSTWSSNSQAPSRAQSEAGFADRGGGGGAGRLGFGGSNNDLEAAGAGGMPVQSQLFMGD